MLFLIMQFLWKYIDDIMGKGVEISVILKLLFYTSANIIPLALPIAVLFSSIMTMGNLAESSELTSMKASGMSLFKVMKPMFIFVLIISVFAFYFSNYILPIANLKQRTLIYDLQSKKPAFALQEGVFYNDIEGYSIKVDKKNEETGKLEGVLIYQTLSFGKSRIVKAKQGELIGSDNDLFLLLKLEDGVIYEEANSSFGKNAKNPFRKSFFEESIVKFDMSSFKLQKSDEELFKREYEMMSYKQLAYAIDSFKLAFDSTKLSFSKTFINQIQIYNVNNFDEIDSVNIEQFNTVKKIDTIVLIHKMSSADYKTALQVSQGKLRSKKDYIMMNSQMSKVRQNALNEYKTEWHKKFTLSIAILVLFFIGAPLGAIIKKGGLGAPLIFATLFFLLYYIMTTTGENMVDTNMISPFWGMWFSTIVLIPLGFFLTYKAANDSALFDRDAYKKWFNKIFKK
jgi:lipopolysaccharide export system permease protein